MTEIRPKFSVVNNADVQLIVQQYLGDKYFTISNFFVKALGENASGFISDHAILTVNVCLDGENDKIYSFFLKIFSEETIGHAQYIEEIGAFKKEVQLFNGLIPLLQKCSSKQWSPKCLYSRKDLLVFENLATLGYFNCEYNKKTILDLDHCVEGAKALARLHAASIILETKPVDSTKSHNILQEFGNILKENTYVSDIKNPRKKWLDVSVRATLALMRLVPELKSVDKQTKINEALPKIFLDLPNVVKASSRYRNVMGHGDIWSNNMMFLYEDGKPVDCRLVDYQFSRYAPASWDLMCMLHLTATREFRDKYMGTVVDAYYNVIKEELEKYNLGEYIKYILCSYLLLMNII